jgi:hypothetical protein
MFGISVFPHLQYSKKIISISIDIHLQGATISFQFALNKAKISRNPHQDLFSLFNRKISYYVPSIGVALHKVE